MPKGRSWWHLRKVRHRDAVLLSMVSSACLLAGELVGQALRATYEQYLQPVAGNPPVFVFTLILTILAFTTYFGGIFVLLGGIHFSWGRVGRGRFLVGLGLGVSLIGLVSRISRAILTPGGLDLELRQYTATLTGIGILLGIGSHTLMGQYALMLKKHAKRVWRRWRRANRPVRPSRRSSRS
ncbi:MAG TPA: hypothetical protein VJ224_02505 [Thermoplasmata archaeon]|nr:hypothetical protein [Thermoplasmata archaeon]